jgi:hypothetical protein
LWHFLVYTGKEMKLESSLIPADMKKRTVVLKLVELLLKQWWAVWIDTTGLL